MEENNFQPTKAVKGMNKETYKQKLMLLGIGETYAEMICEGEADFEETKDAVGNTKFIKISLRGRAPIVIDTEELNKIKLEFNSRIRRTTE